MKVILILVDGMRPDALHDIPQAQKMMGNSTYTLNATTVLPSVTLPCHMSLFHSVEPIRHGITTNLYVPQVRPVKGLCEVLFENGKNNAFFYNWEELRDLARPGTITNACFVSGRKYGYEKANFAVTDAAIECVSENDIDFAFLYLGYVDMAGHDHGWMSEQYMQAINNSWENIQKVVDAVGEEYTVIVTADHGGIGRGHGGDTPQEMTIPIFISGKGFEKGKQLSSCSIMDIAPTVAKLLGVEPDGEWEGKSLI